MTTQRSVSLPSWGHDVARGLDESIPFLDTPLRVCAILIDLCSSPAHSLANMGAEDLLPPADHLLLFAGRLNLQGLCARRPGWRSAAAHNNHSHEWASMQTLTLPVSHRGGGAYL